MSEVSNDNLIEAFERINDVGREFRQHCKTGKLPRLEYWLTKVPPSGRENLFQILFPQKLNYRRKKGEQPTSEEYVRRFPEFEKIIRQAFFESTQFCFDGLLADSDDSGNPGHREFGGISELGNYELLKRLGHGAFGVVFEARHRSTHNVVALKLLPTDFDSLEINADRLHRFRNEFRTLSQFNHPNLVGMQTLEVDDGKWFFTMDLIDGDDFLGYVRPRNILNEQRLRRSLPQIAWGVMALHDLGIVHQDLKPSNVMIESDGTVKILDFGLVADLQGASDQTASLRSTQFVGTPRYAAPEQMFGERSESSDWYAFGVMLYEALTGNAPFTGTQLEVLKQKQNEDPPKLVGQRGIPEDLAQLADSLLRRAPEKRPETSEIVGQLQLNLESSTAGSTRIPQESLSSHGSIEDLLDCDWERKHVELIGREDQLMELEKLKHDFISGSEPQISFVTGLSGEGKSSLVESFLSPIRRKKDMVVLAGRCYDRESVPFKAIDCLIDPLVRFLRTRSPDELTSLIPADIRYLAFLFPLLRRVKRIGETSADEIAGMDALKLKSRAFGAFHDLLFNLSCNYPIILVIDDLQWGDPDSANVLGEILGGACPPKVWLLGSFRSDEAEDSLFLKNWNPIADDSQVRSTVIEVNSLTFPQCIELVKRQTGLEQAKIQPHSRAIYDQSGGNPYFVEQLTEGFNLETGEYNQLPLEEIVANRLRKLPPQATMLLPMIAVAGQAAPVEEISQACGFENPELGTLTHMRSERLVRLFSDGESTTVDTYHDKIRETILNSLSKSDRKRLHMTLGEMIEKRENLDAEKLLEMLSQNTTPGSYPIPISNRVFDTAHHFLMAEDPKAFVYQMLAGEQALQGYAFEEAKGYFEAAEKLIPDSASKDLRFRLFYAIGKTCLANNQTSRAIREFELAEQLAGNQIDKARASLGIVSVFRQLGDLKNQISQCDRSLMYIGSPRPQGLIAKLFSFMTKSLRVMLVPERWQKVADEKDKVLAQLEQSIHLHLSQAFLEYDLIASMDSSARAAVCGLRSGELRPVAHGIDSLASCFSSMGIQFLGHRLSKRADRYDPDFDSKDQHANAIHLAFRGYAAYWGGNLEVAKKMFSKAGPQLLRCGEFAECIRSNHMYRHTLSYCGSSHAELKSANTTLQVAELTQNKEGKCWGNYDIAHCLAKQGRLTEALFYIQKAYRVLNNDYFAMTRVMRSSTDAYVRLQGSDYAKSCELTEHAWRICKRNWFFWHTTLLCLPFGLEAHIGSCWLDRASKEKKKQIRRWMRRAKWVYAIQPNLHPHLQRVFGRAAATLGWKNKAIKRFNKAIRLAEKKGMEYQLAKSLLDLAAVDEENRDRNRMHAIDLLKKVGAVIPNAESWLLGDQPDSSVVAPQIDFESWEIEHGPVTHQRNSLSINLEDTADVRI